jgi:PBP1b-binding outer membrane lipoprotein LpoB
MKTTIYSALILSAMVLTSCQTEEQRKLTEERIKAERTRDSIDKINKELLPYLDCEMRLLLVGASKEEACQKCKEIRPKGFYYDSINKLADTTKTK